MSITGVDIPISLIRDDFAAGLWPDVSNKIYYSRAFITEKSIGGGKEIIPEVYTGSKEYQEVLFDDRYNVSVFFTADDARNNLKEKPETVISAIFSVNLDAIYPGVAWRQEENVHADVLQIFQVATTAYSIQSIDMIVGLNAYDPFFKENVKQYDTQPWHVFKLNLGIKYYYDCNDDAYNRGDDNTYPDPVIIN